MSSPVGSSEMRRSPTGRPTAESSRSRSAPSLRRSRHCGHYHSYYQERRRRQGYSISSNVSLENSPIRDRSPLADSSSSNDDSPPIDQDSSDMSPPLSRCGSPIAGSLTNDSSNSDREIHETNQRIWQSFYNQDKDGVLHQLPRVRQPHLIRDKDFNSCTLLHHAAVRAWPDVCQTLIEQYGCRADDTDVHGQSALHKACQTGHVSVVKYLLTLDSIRATIGDRDHSGHTAIEGVYRNKYEIYSLFASHVDLKMELPVNSCFKLFMAGNSRSGKTTLTAVLKKVLRRPSSSGMVENIKQLTAGIIPTQCSGVLAWPFNLVIYDLAGHNEYYSSHAAVIETLTHDSPAIFMILVDLSKAEGDIKKELYYWASFLKTLTQKIASRIILVGSHADKLSSDPRQLKEKHECVKEIAKDAIQEEQFVGFFQLDCRQLSKNHIQPLREVLVRSVETLTTRWKNEKMYFSCHLLHRLLTDKVNETAITLKDLMQVISSEDLPAVLSDPEIVAASLEVLVNKGLVLFHRSSSGTCILSSCIVKDQQALLEEVNGKLFAPVTFSEHRQIASNTGIVPVSLLHQTFPDYNAEMLVVLLTVLEFCYELDPTVLKAISTNLSMEFTSGERLLFFPALVSAVRPGMVINIRGFGWAVFCNNPYQILTTRVLQVILLRLPFKFCLPQRSRPTIDLPRARKLRPLARECTVWKNGIRWTTEDGIEAIVEVSEQHRRVSVIVSWDESNIIEHVKLRSSLIAEILAILREFCPLVELKECVIPSDDVKRLLDHDLAEMSVFSMCDVARSILRGKDTVPSAADIQKKAPLLSLLLTSDPYQVFLPQVVQLLFEESKSSQPVSESILRQLHGHDRVMGSMSLPTAPTHQDLREQLNKLSIFAGRNPLDVGGMTAGDLPHTPTKEPLVSSHLDSVFELLEDITDWKVLGLKLGLPFPKLDKIDRDKHRVDDCKMAMLHEWLTKGEATRKSLASALRRMGEDTLAERALTISVAATAKRTLF